MKKWLCLACLAILALPVFAAENSDKTLLLTDVKTEVAQRFALKDGLPDLNALSVACASDGSLLVGTAKGVHRFADGAFKELTPPVSGKASLLASAGDSIIALVDRRLVSIRDGASKEIGTLPDGGPAITCMAFSDQPLLGTEGGLMILKGSELLPLDEKNSFIGKTCDVRAIAAGPKGELAVGAASGLFLRDAGGQWNELHPHQGARSWSPRDVRGVAFDSLGRLWFASPQGAGCLQGEAWTLLTHEEGLPYNDFTALAAGPNGEIYFGTAKGAIRYSGGQWEYRGSPRWLPDEKVAAIAVDAKGKAWFATPGGIGSIEKTPMSLAEKARFLETEIDKYHRRTPYGYVMGVHLTKPGDKSEWQQRDSDNDGLWTSMYGAGECFAYAATKDPFHKERAKAAFDALKFLSDVTQGGEHPAPKGFPARSILPINGENPNEHKYTLESDQEKKAGDDPLWKVIHPRWPRSADGK